MGKIIKITESQLKTVINNIINEEDHEEDNGMDDIDYNKKIGRAHV